MEILFLIVAFALGGTTLYVGVRIGYKLSKGQEPIVEPVKAVAKAVQSVASAVPKDKEEDPWEVGMRSILNYDGIKDK